MLYSHSNTDYFTSQVSKQFSLWVGKENLKARNIHYIMLHHVNIWKQAGILKAFYNRKCL